MHSDQPTARASELVCCGRTGREGATPTQGGKKRWSTVIGCMRVFRRKKVGKKTDRPSRPCRHGYGPRAPEKRGRAPKMGCSFYTSICTLLVCLVAAMGPAMAAMEQQQSPLPPQQQQARRPPRQEHGLGQVRHQQQSSPPEGDGRVQRELRRGHAGLLELRDDPHAGRADVSTATTIARHLRRLRCAHVHHSMQPASIWL